MCWRSRQPWALLGAGCSNQMQVPEWQGLVKDCALVQAAIGCCMSIPLEEVFAQVKHYLKRNHLSYYCTSDEKLCYICMSPIGVSFGDPFTMLAIGNRCLPGWLCRIRCPFCWFQVKVTREHMCSTDGGVLSLSADSWQSLFRNCVMTSTRRHPFSSSADFWQRHTRNSVRSPEDGILSVSTTFWQRPGPRVRSLVWP